MRMHRRSRVLQTPVVADCGRCRVSVHGYVEIETLEEWPNVKVRAVPLGLAVVLSFVLTGDGLRAGVGRAGDGEACSEGGDAGAIDRRPGARTYLWPCRAHRGSSALAQGKDQRVEGVEIVMRTL